MVGFATCFQGYQTADRYRTKLAQVFIYPDQQRKGLGSLLYKSIY
jgi:GNAT superfamily N-acetyltransferase